MVSDGLHKQEPLLHFPSDVSTKLISVFIERNNIGLELVDLHDVDRALLTGRVGGSRYRRRPPRGRHARWPIRPWHERRG
eukprot:16099565-Heterocapsa_arctica.AAC.1